MKEKETYDDGIGDKFLSKSLRTTPFVVPTDFFAEQEEKIKSQIQLDKNIPSFSYSTAEVPENYFDNLEGNILNRIKEQKLKDIVKTDGYTVPENYFDQLPDSIPVHAFELELKSTITTDGFDVPKDYFSTLAESITSANEIDNLKARISADGFTVPSSYFEDLEHAIYAHIAIDNLPKNVNTDGFTVPVDYFENAEKHIIKLIQPDNVETRKENTPVVSLSKRRISWSKFAAAAAILLFAIGGLISFFTADEAYNPVQRKQLISAIDIEGVSDQELVDYLSQVSDDTDLMQLSEIVEDNAQEQLQSSEEIKTEDIEDYLNYML